MTDKLALFVAHCVHCGSLFPVHVEDFTEGTDPQERINVHLAKSPDLGCTACDRPATYRAEQLTWLRFRTGAGSWKFVQKMLYGDG